MWQQINFEKIK